MKAQMRFQKIICLVMLIIGALALVYACSYLTGSMEYLWTDTNQKVANFKSYIDGGELYLEIQDFNDLLMYFSIVMILVAVLLYITSTNRRRKYYVTNYIATGVCAGADIVLSIIAMVQNLSWKNRFKTEVDFESWAQDAKDFPESVKYSESTVMFDLGTALFVIIIVVSLLLIFNLVWKLMNERQENRLLSNPAEVAAL